MDYENITRAELIKEIEKMHQQIKVMQTGEEMQRNATEEDIYLKKLRGIIEIAEDVLHEMNQPMQAILGYTEILLINTSIDNPIYEKLTMIKKQTIRLSNLTKKLIKIKNYEFQDCGFLDKNC
jgi:signal transduction histidine kinase